MTGIHSIFGDIGTFAPFLGNIAPYDPNKHDPNVQIHLGHAEKSWDIGDIRI